MALIVTLGPTVTAAVQAPTSVSVPELSTDAQKSLRLLMAGMENADLRAQLARSEFLRLKAELEASLLTMKKEGFIIDLSTMKYVPEPKTK